MKESSILRVNDRKNPISRLIFLLGSKSLAIIHTSFFITWHATHCTPETGHSCPTPDASWGRKAPAWPSRGALQANISCSFLECFCRRKSLTAHRRGLLTELPFATEMSVLFQLDRNQRQVLFRVRSTYGSHLLEKKEWKGTERPREINIIPDSGGFQKHIQ